MLKRHRDYKDGLSFGLGHDGIEAVLVGVLGAVNALVLVTMLSANTFDQMIGSALPAEQAQQIKNQLINTGFIEYVIAGVERVAAILIHIALFLLVLLGVRSNRFKYVIYAVVIHALIDIVSGLYQTEVIANIWIAEVFVLLYGIIAFLFINRIKDKF